MNDRPRPQSYPLLRHALLLLMGCTWVLGCRTGKPTTPLPVAAILVPDSLLSDTLSLTSGPLRPSSKRVNDLLHTRLDVSFDCTNRRVLGKATLQLKPYFLPVSSVQLDAVGFDWNEVAMISGNIKTKLKYLYDGKVITIDLGRVFRRNEIYTLYLDYLARPEERALPAESPSRDKGLTFINPLGNQPGMPQQIWTQGEPQHNSSWFPTIDAPNERMTQELAITVDNRFVTLSNGLLVWQQRNPDSTRTDIWKQSLPSPPYLTMLAVGDFSITRDEYKGKEVTYYTDPAYAPYARNIFGKTPEMMEFFSKKLGVEYPWEKYAQVVVRGYPSGSMENTSATLHGQFMQQTARELLDESNEDYIAHELVHQWFGDLVTCESWSNLALNEAFATYGEYLWLEHRYGRAEADNHLHRQLQSYLAEAQEKQVEIIRNRFSDPDELFDAHSYQKGSRVLHMLRYYMGDEAFFAALSTYLEQHKFNSVELSDLRSAFEDVSGEDLNWFFDQWFLTPGHPSLKVRCEYNDSLHKQTIVVDQTQDITQSTLFQLPITVDLYFKGKKERKEILISKAHEVFTFDCAARPDWVNVDAEKTLLGTIDEVKTTSEWVTQYQRGPLYLDRLEALKALRNRIENPVVMETFHKAFSDPNWGIRHYAVEQARELLRISASKSKPFLVRLAQRDPKADVRAEAIAQLARFDGSDDLVNLFKRSLEDSSYHAASEALLGLYGLDKSLGLEFARSFEADSNESMVAAVSEIYSGAGGEAEHAYFLHQFTHAMGYEKLQLVKHYSAYLMQRSDTTINRGIRALEAVALNDENWYVRLSGTNAINLLHNMYQSRQQLARERLNQLQKTNPGSPQVRDLKQSEERSEIQVTKLDALIRNIKTKETDAKLLQIYRNN